MHGIYLEDLYVGPQARGTGAGRALLAALAAICVDRGYRRWTGGCCDWNPAREFYAGIGAAAMDEWIPYRLEGEAATQARILARWTQIATARCCLVARVRSDTGTSARIRYSRARLMMAPRGLPAGQVHSADGVSVDSVPSLERGRQSFAQAEWRFAYDALVEADLEARLRPSDLELLARAAYMLGRDDDYVNALERAHRHTSMRVRHARRSLRLLGRPQLALPRAGGAGRVAGSRGPSDSGPQQGDCASAAIGSFGAVRSPRQRDDAGRPATAAAIS